MAPAPQQNQPQFQPQYQSLERRRHDDIPELRDWEMKTENMSL
jgi:hypothetical protein